MKYSIYILLLFFLVSCFRPEPRKPISRKTSTFLKESIDRNKKINEIEEQLFKKLMQEDTIHTYNASDNGFWYYIEGQKDTLHAQPKKGDVVTINYEIKDIENNIIYAKEELGSADQKELGDRTYKVDGEEFITGLQEGIKLMRQGETATFLLPSNKAFGVSGYQDKIKPNQPLIIRVFLKEIKKVNN